MPKLPLQWYATLEQTFKSIDANGNGIVVHHYINVVSISVQFLITVFSEVSMIFITSVWFVFSINCDLTIYDDNHNAKINM